MLRRPSRPPSWIVTVFILLTCAASGSIAPTAEEVLGEWCRQCPPGEEQTSYCTKTRPSQCAPCAQGFYSPVHNRLPCRPCSTCAPGYIRTGACTKTRDTQCVQKDEWASRDWLTKQLGSTDVTSHSDDVRPSHDVTVSIETPPVKDDGESPGGSVGKINENHRPLGPPVGSQYNSGTFKGRETLGFDSAGETEPLPSQTPPQGGRHSRQKRQTTTTLRTSPLSGVQSTPLPPYSSSSSTPRSTLGPSGGSDIEWRPVGGPEEYDDEKDDDYYDGYDEDDYDPFRSSHPQGPPLASDPGPGISNHPGHGTERRPGEWPEGTGLGPQAHPGEQSGGQRPGGPPAPPGPPGGDGSNTGGTERGNVPETRKNNIPPDIINDNFGGPGKKNKPSSAEADSINSSLNDIVGWVVMGGVVLILVAAALGFYMNRGRFLKPNPLPGDTSCATYDKDEGGVTVFIPGNNKGGYPDDGDDVSLYIKDDPEIPSGISPQKGVGGKKVQNTVRPASPYDNITPEGFNNPRTRTDGETSPVDDFSRVVDETLEGAGNKRDSYHGFTDTLRSSRGRLLTDGGTGSESPILECVNPIFTGALTDPDVETDGPAGSNQRSRGSPALSSGTHHSTTAPSEARSSPAPSAGASSLASSGINNSNRSSVLNSLAKDAIKPSNVNFNTASASPKMTSSNIPSQNNNNNPRAPYSQRPHHRSYKMSESENSFGGLFDQRGGRLQSEDSAISLRLPRGAVPPEQTWAIRGYIHLDLQPFVKHIDWENGECMISPVPEYHVVDGHHFTRLVHVRIPHCLDEQELMPYIRVQHGDPSNNRAFQDVPLQAKENNIRQNIYFSVEENYINIYTSHFTQFICSCKKPYNLQLEAMLFGSYSCLGEQEVKLRLYLCDALFKVDDFRQDLIKREKNNLLESSTVALPNDGLTAQSEIDMELKSQDSDWQPQTICGVQVSEMKQTKKLGDLVCCHASRYEAPVAADFVMVPSPKAERKTFFKGLTLVTPRVLNTTPTKQKKKKFGFIGGKNRVPEKDAEKDAECKPTKICFGFSFGYEAQRSQNGDAGEAGTSDLDEDEAETLDEETLEAFEFISRHLPRSNMLPLSRKLGLEQTTVEELEERYRHSLQEQKMQMLLLWKRRKAGRATVQQLMKHLVKLQQADLADELAEILEIEMDEMAIPAEKEQIKNKSRSKHSLKIPDSNPKRGNKSGRTKREYISQSSGISSENGGLSSPDSEPVAYRQGMRVSESSEGYISASGSNRNKRNNRDRPHVKIPNSSSFPDVEIRKDQVPKRTSRLRQQQPQKQQQQRQQEHKHKNGVAPTSRLTRAHDNRGSTCSTDSEEFTPSDSGTLGKHSGRSGKSSVRFGRNSGVSGHDSDLIISDGGSDIAEVSDGESDENEVVTSTMLDCGNAESKDESATEEEEECSSSEPTSPDSLLHQTVPKTLDEHYSLEHVNV